MSDIVAIASLPVGLCNRFYNGNFAINPEGTESGADGSPCFRFYTRLSQSANTQTSQLITPSSDLATALRQTQTSATAQRMGIAQTIIAIDCQDARAQPLRFGAQVRFSENARTMYAVLSWAGTADASPADPVQDWTSTNYAPGGFFKSSFTVLAYGFLSATATNWALTPYIPMQAGASLNNLVGMVWTEGTAPQNATLDMGDWQIVSSPDQIAFERRPYLLQTAMENPVDVSAAWQEVIEQTTLDAGVALFAPQWQPIITTTIPAGQRLIDAGQPFTDLAGAGSIDLGAVASNKVRITGTTTITSFGTAASGVVKLVKFASALTLTYNATSMILPGKRSLVMAANDTLMAVSLGSGNWQAVWYQPAIGPIPEYDVRQWGATGDGTTDDTAAINNAALAVNALGGGILVFPAGTFLVTSVTAKANVTFRGAGVDITIIKLASGTNGNVVTMESQSALIGMTVDQNAPGNPVAGSCVIATTATDILLDTVKLYRATGSGAIVQTSSQRARLRHIQCDTIAGHGLSLSVSDYLEVQDIRGTAIGLALVNLAQCSYCTGGDFRLINSVAPSAGDPVLRIVNSSNHNTFTNITGDKVSRGLFVLSSTYNAVSNCVFSNTYAEGVLVQATGGIVCTNNVISNVSIQNPGTGAGAGATDGVRVDGAEYNQFSNITAIDAGAHMEYAYRVTNNGTANGYYNTLTGGLFGGWTVADFSLAFPDRNTLNGVISTTYQTSVASASSITLQAAYNVVQITGTTNITAILGQWRNRRVTLVFSDALTVVDGGNLNLAGNFVTTTGDTLTLISDGSNWNEVARSIN